MHRLGSRLVFSQVFVVYLAEYPFLRVIASHSHYTHSTYVLCIYISLYKHTHTHYIYI